MSKDDNMLSHDEKALSKMLFTPMGPYNRDAIICDSLHRIAVALEQVVEKLDEISHHASGKR